MSTLSAVVSREEIAAGDNDHQHWGQTPLQWGQEDHLVGCHGNQVEGR